MNGKFYLSNIEFKVYIKQIKSTKLGQLNR